jgi:hypothetical protein
LIPSVRRGYLADTEQMLSNDFFVRAKLRYPNCPADSDYAGWLALMQHYGVPTRLLDWSRSPLVAAYFATENAVNRLRATPYQEACIWALNPGRLNESEGFKPLIYPLSAKTLSKMVVPSRKGPDGVDKVAAAMPVETDLRMMIQQGAFTLHVTGRPLEQRSGCEEWLRKFVIPGNSVEIIAHELNVLSFRHGDLFPDLGNLATELKRLHRRRASLP